MVTIIWKRPVWPSALNNLPYIQLDPAYNVILKDYNNA